MMFGALVKSNQRSYVRIFKNREIFFGGVKPIRHFAVNGDLSLKQLLLIIGGDGFFAFDVIDKKNKRTHHLNVKQTEELLSSYRYYEKVSDIIAPIIDQK